MTEPELEGMGVPSASRRKFMWLGGGAVASLLFLPEFALAAKVAKAVKTVATGKAGKPRKPAGAASSSATGRSSSPGKPGGGATTPAASAKGQSAGKAAKATPRGKGAGSRSANLSTTKRSKGAVATRRKATRTRGNATARAEVVEPASDLELPSSYAPGRAFSFGAGSPESRDLSLYCVHTGEQLRIDYYVDGRYEPDALAAIDHLLRDYHNDEICQFDPRVLNQLFDLRRALGSGEPFHVFSGYRSPETNESYRRLSGRVAEHSYHMTGQAIDIQLPGRDVRQLRNVAVAMRAGGVGYYPQDGFLHLDSGPVRRW